MFYWTIFVCFLGFVFVKSTEQDQPEIKFEIFHRPDSNNNIICDHSDDKKQENKYTVREGEEFTIITTHFSYINHLICSNYNDNKMLSNNNDDLYTKLKKKASLNVTTFKVEKRMGDLWKCMVLAHKYNKGMKPVVQYQGESYSAAYCYMKIHVRQKNLPQTILVNNMVLQANRTDLSEKNFDFIAEYQYADGDVVNVTCAKFLNQTAPLTMEYVMAGTISHNSTLKKLSKELSSYKAIGFRAKLHSGYNNSYMICTNTESTDYTKVMVRFIMRTEFNIVSIKINGMTIRPILKNNLNHNYGIDYKYQRNQHMTVVCEVQRSDVKLVVVDDIDFVNKVSSYKKKELPGKKAEMSFNLENQNKKLLCSSDYIPRRLAEQVDIIFAVGSLDNDRDSMYMELPSNGTVMELNDDKLKVIFYEFKDGETLQLYCGPLILPDPGPVMYLQFNDSVSDTCKRAGCTIDKTLTVTRKDENTALACYLKEQNVPAAPLGSKDDKVLREIRVILNERVLTTTSTTTTTTTTTTSTMEPPKDANTSPANTLSGASSDPREKEDYHKLTLGGIVGAVLCIIIICASTIIVKLRKRNHSQGGPHNSNYENLQNPSETSIPTYPPQWESNYAVPVDRRAEDTTYSVPCQEPALYSTPTPKNLRNKKQKPDDPTYAVLEVPNAQGRKNIFKETDDPNYSEVYANRQEQCYAKVLPKSVRDKLAQDNNPYSYVTNEPPYANAAEPEPMYCEPAKPQDGTYANLNNSHYANSNAHEYVEPTYCEPQKRMK